MMMCMAALQVFIVRFFFQVCCSSLVMDIEVVLMRSNRVPGKVTCERIGYGIGADEMNKMILGPEGPSVYYIHLTIDAP